MTRTPIETEVAELRADLASLGRYLLATQGAKPGLVAIIQRNQPDTSGLQIEQREAVVS